MSTTARIILAIIAASIYAGLIILKIIRFRHPRLCILKEETSESGEPENVDLPEKARFQDLRFGLIRLGVDCVLMVGFLLSDLCPIWFRLNRETALGYCTGCIILISITLLISVFVDWFPVRNGYLRAGKQPPSFSRFMLSQLLGIIRIEFVLILIWSVFLILEPTKTSIIIKIILSVLMLLLIRLLPLWLTRKPDDSKPPE